jgi:hypothetical protein
MRSEIEETLRKLEWMRSEGICPNGPRYLWTDAFGVGLIARPGSRLTTPGAGSPRGSAASWTNSVSF